MTMNGLIRKLSFVILLGMQVFCVNSYGKKADLTMCSSFAKAEPVWAVGREKEVNLILSFRTVMDFKVKPKQALVRLAASTNFRVKVNGVFIAHGPAVAAHDFYRIDVYDISQALKAGKNIVSIEVAGYNVSSYYLLNQPSFLQAEVEVGGKVLAATGDGTIKAYELKQRLQSSPKLGFQRSTREDYILSPDFEQWETNPDWQGTEVALGPVEHKNLIVRRVAHPDYTVHEARMLQKNVYKFQCNSSGFLGMKIKVTEPSKLVAGFDELIGDDGHVNYKRLGISATVTYDLQPGEYNLETFEPYTMQYVEFEVNQGNVEVERVYLRDYCNGNVNHAKFESDNPGLNRLFEAARETHRQNSTDVFMDCPSRERAGWLCDSYFSSRVAFDLSGNTTLEKNFIENFVLPKEFKDIDSGMLPMCYPSDHWNHNYIPNWAMWFVVELREYLARSGDRTLVDKAKPRVYGLVNYFKPFLNSDGLLEKLKNWVFVEWSAANDYVQDVNYPSNMLYAEMLDAAGDMYGDNALKVQAENVRKEIRRQAYDGQFFCDNALRKDGRLERTNNHTEVCQYYAFFFKVATRTTYPELWNKLQKEFGPQRKIQNPYPDVPFCAAFIGKYLRLELLSEAGLSKQILDESIAEFTKMAELTGTLWEKLEPEASCNHGFAAHIAHTLYRDILGVYKIDPILKKVTLRFIDSDVKHCKGSMPLGQEQIDLEWQVKDGMLYYKIHLPKGYKAEVSPQSTLPSKEGL